MNKLDTNGDHVETFLVTKPPTYFILERKVFYCALFMNVVPVRRNTLRRSGLRYEPDAFNDYGRLGT